jgi:hypothetical protein
MAKLPKNQLQVKAATQLSSLIAQSGEIERYFECWNELPQPRPYCVPGYYFAARDWEADDLALGKQMLAQRDGIKQVMAALMCQATPEEAATVMMSIIDCFPNLKNLETKNFAAALCEIALAAGLSRYVLLELRLKLIKNYEFLSVAAFEKEIPVVQAEVKAKQKLLHGNELECKILEAEQRLGLIKGERQIAARCVELGLPVPETEEQKYKRELREEGERHERLYREDMKELQQDLEEARAKLVGAKPGGWWHQEMSKRLAVVETNIADTKWRYQWERKKLLQQQELEPSRD